MPDNFLWTALLRSELDSLPLRQSTVVVIDVLRATSTVVTALAHGARAVLPSRGVEQARRLRKKGWILAGERGGVAPRGFDRGNSPLEFLAGVKGKTVVLSTTNGTAALDRCRRAKKVYLASFLNLRAVARLLQKEKGCIGLVCAGDAGAASLEDTVCAGMIAASLARSRPAGLRLNDGTIVALSLAGAFPDPLSMMKCSGHGRELLEHGFAPDLAFASQRNLYHIVPHLKNGLIIL